MRELLNNIRGAIRTGPDAQGKLHSNRLLPSERRETPEQAKINDAYDAGWYDALKAIEKLIEETNETHI